MRTMISDIETDSLEPLEHIWLFGGLDYDTGERFQFTNILHIPEEREKAIEWASTVDRWVFHYGLSFDVPVLNNYLGVELVPYEKVVDTLVLSTLHDFDIDGGHSLDAWGKRLGRTQKGKFKDFGRFSQEMVDYWNDDLTLTKEVFDHFQFMLNDPKWGSSIKVEHEIACECRTIHENGFTFNVDKATGILEEVTSQMQKLEEEFQLDFPPKLDVVKVLKYRTYKGTDTPVDSIKKAMDEFSKTEIVNDELLCYDYKPFKPGSPTQRVERLWEAGWKPYEKTKTHQEYVRDKQRMGKRYYE